MAKEVIDLGFIQEASDLPQVFKVMVVQDDNGHRVAQVDDIYLGDVSTPTFQVCLQGLCNQDQGLVDILMARVKGNPRVAQRLLAARVAARAAQHLLA